MTLGPLPENERDRLEELRRYRILDTEFEKDFDGIVELASEVCHSPIAMINLVDENRQWSKSRVGTDITESAREFSFCAHAINGDDVMIVTDALNDPRFSHNPYVLNEPNIRFYAGMPIVVKSGHKLGTLCVIDRVPKTLNDRQLQDLRILANQVVNLLELRLSNLNLQRLVMNKTFELSKLFDRIGDAFLSLDKNWNYIYVNKQLGELLKKEPSQLIGKNIWKEFPETVNSGTYQAFHRALREQKYICHIDYYEPLKLWQENHIYPSPDGLSVFIRDITQQKRTERRLVESIETLERAEEQAQMGSWQLDVPTGKITWSKQLFLLFGFDSGEVPSFESILERVHPEDRSIAHRLAEKIQEGANPGESILRTNPLVLPLRYLLSYTRQIKDQKGDTVRFEGIMIDVSELHKTNNELDHFVYSISHDIRSPLATILGLLNVAELENPNTLSPHLKLIRDQVYRLDNVIREILNYSMNARTETRSEKIDFHSLLETAKRSLTPPVQTGNIQIAMEISGGVDFFSDKIRMEIIFKNLYSNSIRYQDPKKSFCSIKIQVINSVSQTRIIYSDNGIGIDKHHLGKVFNMFYRATENAKGSGLGLYVTREAIHKLGGTIRVQSELGVGTTFEMIIPNSLPQND